MKTPYCSKLLGSSSGGRFELSVSIIRVCRPGIQLTGLRGCPQLAAETRAEHAKTTEWDTTRTEETAMRLRQLQLPHQCGQQLRVPLLFAVIGPCRLNHAAIHVAAARKHRLQPSPRPSWHGGRIGRTQRGKEVGPIAACLRVALKHEVIVTARRVVVLAKGAGNGHALRREISRQ